MKNAQDTVNYTFQGLYVNIHAPMEPLTRRTGSKRGLVVDFSDRSRKRLIDRLHQFKFSGLRATFVTLTYPAVYPDPHTAKQHLKAFFKRLRRKFPEANMSGVWRLEFQKRGAPHFHILLFNLPFYSKSELWRVWGEIIGAPSVSVDIRLVDGYSHIRNYISKYIAKVHAPDGPCFNSVPKRAVLGDDFTDIVRTDTGEVINESVGRFWGVFNRANLPYAPRVIYRVPANAFEVMRSFKNEMRVVYCHMNRYPEKGATLYCDDAVLWQRLLIYLIQVYADDL